METFYISVAFSNRRSGIGIVGSDGSSDKLALSNAGFRETSLYCMGIIHVLNENEALHNVTLVLRSTQHVTQFNEILDSSDISSSALHRLLDSSSSKMIRECARVINRMISAGSKVQITDMQVKLQREPKMIEARQLAESAMTSGLNEGERMTPSSFALRSIDSMMLRRLPCHSVIPRISLPLRTLQYEPESSTIKNTTGLTMALHQPKKDQVRLFVLCVGCACIIVLTYTSSKDSQDIVGTETNDNLAVLTTCRQCIMCVKDKMLENSNGKEVDSISDRLFLHVFYSMKNFEGSTSHQSLIRLSGSSLHICRDNSTMRYVSIDKLRELSDAGCSMSSTEHDEQGHVVMSPFFRTGFL